MSEPSKKRNSEGESVTDEDRAWARLTANETVLRECGKTIEQLWTGFSQADAQASKPVEGSKGVDGAIVLVLVIAAFVLGALFL